ncbi:hypothetical protein [Hymenobacter terricola]|uniref:hypothetical protein n=1 Tax=Hymenobacter terricola TaxID=2819236 RepID=UPI001B301015|nr:hypothetical protein [Hymenobacter terricola]
MTTLPAALPKCLLFLLLMAFSWAAPAQVLPPAQVPPAARAAFKAKFPAAKTVAWTKADDGQYTASFRRRGSPMAVQISPIGTLAATRLPIPPAKLPARVRATLAHDYSEYQVTEAAIYVSDAGVKTYQVEVSIEGSHHPVVFRADGSRVKNKRAKK